MKIQNVVAFFKHLDLDININSNLNWILMQIGSFSHKSNHKSEPENHEQWETFFPKSWAYHGKEMLMLVAEYPKECLHLDVLSPYRHNPRKHYQSLSIKEDFFADDQLLM